MQWLLSDRAKGTTAIGANGSASLSRSMQSIVPDQLRSRVRQRRAHVRKRVRVSKREMRRGNSRKFAANPKSRSLRSNDQSDFWFWIRRPMQRRLSVVVVPTLRFAGKNASKSLHVRIRNVYEEEKWAPGHFH